MRRVVFHRKQHSRDVIQFQVMCSFSPIPIRLFLLGLSLLPLFALCSYLIYRPGHPIAEKPRLSFESCSWFVLGFATVAAYYWKLLNTTVISESLVVFRELGVQLETERGIAGRVLSTSRRFIPAECIHDILINEALSGWEFKHYLTVIAVPRPSSSSLYLSVVFENILPPVDILSKIYRDLHASNLFQK